MNNDEMALINQLNESRWLAINPSYRERQHKRYRDAIAVLESTGWQRGKLSHTTLNKKIVWRASSEANMLMPQEHSYADLTSARIDALLTDLGWE